MDEFDKLLADLKSGEKKSINRKDFDAILKDFNGENETDGSFKELVAEVVPVTVKHRGRPKKNNGNA